MKVHMNSEEMIGCPRCRKMTYHRKTEHFVFYCDNCGHEGVGAEGIAMSEGDYIRSLSDYELSCYLACHSFKTMSCVPQDGVPEKLLNYLIGESGEIKSCLNIHYS